MTTAMVALAVAATTGSLRADSFRSGTVTSTPVAPGNIYSSIGGNAGIQRLPTWNRVGDIGPNSANPFFQTVNVAGHAARQRLLRLRQCDAGD